MNIDAPFIQFAMLRHHCSNALCFLISGNKTVPVHQPHDKLIKQVLKEKSLRKEFFEYALPENIKTHIDLNQLALCNTTFIDEAMRGTSCDLLFSTQYSGQPGYLYLLCEAQSTVDAMMAFRLWRYLLSICDEHLKTHGGKGPLPLVYPVVLYSGIDKPWNAPLNLIELFDPTHQNLMRPLLHDAFPLVDINCLNADKLSRYQRFELLVTTLKCRKNLNQEEFISKLANAYLFFMNSEEMKNFDAIMTYIFECCNVTSPESFEQRFIDALPQAAKGSMDTIAQYFVDKGMQQGVERGIERGLERGIEKGKIEGIQEGIEKGIEKGKLETALNLVSLGQPISIASKATGLPEKTIRANLAH